MTGPRGKVPAYKAHHLHLKRFGRRSPAPFRQVPGL